LTGHGKEAHNGQAPLRERRQPSEQHLIDAIKPAENNGEFSCRVCGGKLSARADDQDEKAINQRHDIYYDTKKGTLAAVQYSRTVQAEPRQAKIVELDGGPGVKEVSEDLLKKLK